MNKSMSLLKRGVLAQRHIYCMSQAGLLRYRPVRMFSSQEKAKNEEAVKEEAVKEEDKWESKEDKEQDYSEEEEEPEEDKNEFKPHRQFMFLLGKAFKYSFWVTTALFAYHLYQVSYAENPQEKMFINEVLLEYASTAKYMFDDLSSLMTRPAVD
jgi:hypothetical protein